MFVVNVCCITTLQNADYDCGNDEKNIDGPFALHDVPEIE